MEAQVPEEELLKAVEDDPHDVDAKLRLATYLRRDNNPAKALPVLKGALKIDPHNPEIHLQLGLCWAMSMLENVPTIELWGRDIDEEDIFENALESLETASELDPELTAAYNAMGRLYVIRFREEEAIEMFRQSLQVDPAQLDILEELQELTGRPVWNLLDKETYMGEEEDI